MIRFFWFLFGLVAAVGIFCAVVGITSLINHVSFAQQIVNWFSTFIKTASTASETVETVAALPIM